MSARDALFNDIWDMRTTAEKNALIDAHRDEVALEIGRDALRDGLLLTLTRLVGEANATRLLADGRAASDGCVEATARNDLVAALAEHACCYTEEEATRMVDAFAHELADQQRAHAEAEDGEPGCWHDGAHGVANLIDPLKGKP